MAIPKLSTEPKPEAAAAASEGGSTATQAAIDHDASYILATVAKKAVARNQNEKGKNIAAGSRGVLGLLLAFAVSLGSGEVVSAATRSINLNTGWDQWSNSLIAVGQRDNEWRVGSSPLNGGAAFVVNGQIRKNFNSMLSTQFPNSGWISINATATPLSPSPSSYNYEYYFTLPPGFSLPQLTMKLSSDDHITHVTLNNCDLFPLGSGGIFANSLPLMLSSTALSPACFTSGSIVNVVTVTVEDTALVVTGLVVAGTVSYQDCDRPAVRSTPGADSITFYELSSAVPMTTTFQIGDPKLTTRIATGSLGQGPGKSSDFQGVAGKEFYDVFFSDWDGTVNPNGQFVTIEALWDVGAPAGGGLNIGAVQLSDSSASSTRLADFVSSFVVLGDNALPMNVGNAVDMSPASATTMGNTLGQKERRLRVTVGFPCPCTKIDVRAQYAVKFACYEAAERPLALVSGYYGTAINVHEPRLPPAPNVRVQPTHLAKKVAEALPGEKVGLVSPYRVETLGPDQAFEIDCAEILKIAGFSPGFHTGFVVIESDSPLDVTAIYTGRPVSGQVSTMDVENVPERKMDGTLTVCPPTGGTEICISKFYDKNRDGKQQATEMGLQGWTFRATDQAGNVFTSPPTLASGAICFAVPAPASYVVSEVPQAGWIQTSPVTPANPVVTVSPGGPVVNLVFGNWNRNRPSDDEHGVSNDSN